MMRMVSVVGMAGLAAALAVTASGAEVTERRFVSGGTVRLNLSAGDYEIVGTRDEPIRVSWDDHAKNPEVNIVVRLSARATSIATSTPR